MGGGKEVNLSNRTYVCTKCRSSRRAAAKYGLNTDLRCRECGGQLWEIEWRWRIPRKIDHKGWRELGEKVSRDSKQQWPVRARRGLLKLNNLDRQIDDRSRGKLSPANAKKLKKLKKERARVVHDYI